METTAQKVIGGFTAGLGTLLVGFMAIQGASSIELRILAIAIGLCLLLLGALFIWQPRWVHQAFLERAAVYIIPAMLALFIGLAVTADPNPIGTHRVDPSNDDSRQNLAYAYNLAKYGVFSRSEMDSPAIRGDHYREPVYPVWVALGLRLMTRVRTVSYHCFIEEMHCADLRVFARRMNIPVFIGLIGTLIYAVEYLTKHKGAALFAAVLLLCGDMLYLQAALSEMLAALHLLLHALLLSLAYNAYRRGQPAIWLAGLSSVALGLLILTKAVFLYWGVILGVTLAAYCLWRLIRHQPTRLPAMLTAVLIAPAMLITGIWIVRSHALFGDFAIADRDAIVLAVRAEYSYIQPNEYLAAFAFYASPELQRVLLPLFDESDYHRLDRNNTDSLEYRTMRATSESRVIALAYAQEGLKPIRPAVLGTFVLTDLDESDQVALKRAAIQTLKTHWLTQLALVPLFANRGAFVPVEPYVVLVEPLVQRIAYWILRIVRHLFVPALIVVTGQAIWKRDLSLALFFLPAVFSYGIHAAATHYIPRYSATLVPCLIVALAFALMSLWNLTPKRTTISGTPFADENVPQ